MKRPLGKVAAVALLLGAAAGVGAWFLVPPPRSEVRTLLRVPTGAPYLFRTREAIPDRETHQRNQIAMGKSRLVLTRALQDQELADLPLLDRKPDPVAWLETNVLIDFTVAPEIMKISMKGAPAQEEDLGKVVNAIREAYLEMVVDRDKFLRRQRLQYVEKNLENYENELKEARKPQKKLEAQLGGRDAAYRARLLSSLQRQLERTEGELFSTRSELRRANIVLSMMKTHKEKFEKLGVSPEDLQQALEKAPETVPQRNEINRLEERVSALKDEIGEIHKHLRPKSKQDPRERARPALQTRLAILEARIAVLKRTEEELEREVKPLRDRVSELSPKGVKLEESREDVSTLVDMTRRLKEEKVALQVELEAPSRVVVLEEATVVRPDARPRKLLLTGAAALGGFLLALLGLFWVRWMWRRGTAGTEPS
jgi:hypothetical protein